MFSLLFTASDKSVWFLASCFVVPVIPANIRPLRHHKGERSIISRYLEKGVTKKKIKVSNTD